MSKQPMTVGDIRKAIRKLPDTAFVLFADTMHDNDREVTGIGPIHVHDGRYGPSLLFKTGAPWFGGEEVIVFQIGGMAANWGDQSFKDFHHDDKPGVEPLNDTELAPSAPVDDDEVNNIVEELLSKRRGQ